MAVPVVLKRTETPTLSQGTNCRGRYNGVHMKAQPPENWLAMMSASPLPSLFPHLGLGRARAHSWPFFSRCSGFCLALFELPKHFQVRVQSWSCRMAAASSVTSKGAPLTGGARGQMRSRGCASQAPRVLERARPERACEPCSVVGSENGRWPWRRASHSGLKKAPALSSPCPLLGSLASFWRLSRGTRAAPRPPHRPPLTRL